MENTDRPAVRGVGWLMLIATVRTEPMTWLDIGVILAAAFLAAQIVPRLARRTVRRALDSRMRRGLAVLRTRAPRALVDSGPVPTIRYGRRADALGTLFKHLSSGVIWLVATILILRELDVALATTITGAGFIGLAIALSAQDLLRDWVAGFFILVDDRFGVGDRVEVGAIVGEIEELTLRWTRIRDAQGTEWYVPNGQLQLVGNRSQHRGKAVVDIDVRSDIELGDALERITKSLQGLRDDPRVGTFVLGEPEILGVETLNREGPTLRIAVLTEPAKQAEVSRAVRARVHNAFEHDNRSRREANERRASGDGW